MANIGANAMSAGIHISGSYNNVTVKNNVISGMQYPYYIEDPAGSGATFVSDYNLLNGASGQIVWGSAFQNYATWKAGGRDANSILGSDPSWVSAPSNLSLNSNSPAVDKGANLSGLGYSILNSDKNNVVRASAWDIGAFEYTGGGSPTTFTITSSAGAGGSISPSGTVTVNSGASQSFSIVPSAQYQVLSVLVDGVSQGAITSYTFSNITSNHTISASFSLIPVPVAGDLNLDHIVNTLDFSLLNSRWNTNYPAYDLVPDGIINTLDFAIMSSNWGKVW
jgi:hypothetical protein